MVLRMELDRKATYWNDEHFDVKQRTALKYFRILILSCFWLIYLCHLSSSLVMKAVYRVTALFVFNVIIYTWLDQVTEKRTDQTIREPY